MPRLVPTRRARLLPVALGVLALGGLVQVTNGDGPPGGPGTATAPVDERVADAHEPTQVPATTTPAPPAAPPIAPPPPPVLRVEAPLPIIGAAPAVVSGATENVTSLRADGRPLPLAADGTFELSVRRVPPDGITFEAAGADGTTVSENLRLGRVPSRALAEEIRGVHVSFYGWADARLREPILEMAEQRRINTVQLDLKDESGMVGYRTEVSSAHAYGAVAGIYDLSEAVRELHERGLHVVGRIVAFRDPVAAAWAWENGRRDMVVQTAGGEPYGGYGGFTNFADAGVRSHNIAIAVEAAAAGVDTILWDYVRRPDGALDALRFPGLDGTPEEAVAAFVAEADEALRPYRVQHGVSVYGIAVDRPRQIAQDIPAMAEHVDVVAPMVYPSHWGPGEYGVADPEAQPYDITLAALRDYAEVLDGSRARVVPWLQDFTLRVAYGPAEVRAQIDAATHAGLDEWLMWDPFVRYSVGAYDAGAAPGNEVLLPPPSTPAVPVEWPT
jgi:hypothetical protein